MGVQPAALAGALPELEESALMTDIADLSALELLALYRSRELSPVEAAEACLARIEALNPVVNAFSQLDRERTLAEARAAERRYAEDAAHGLVDGVPVAVKDIFMQQGWPNLKGSLTVDEHQLAAEDAPAVAALKRHGMVTMGRTTTPEFGWKGVTDNPREGITRNPWDADKTPGGSSGGSASAVVLGMAPLALGTDAGGSIRMPAGYAGLFGHKPTHGLCPMWPPSAFYPLGHVGPMTRTVRESALLMDVLVEGDPRDATLAPPAAEYLAALEQPLGRLRVAFSADFGFYRHVDPEIAEAVAAAVHVFEAELGCVVETVDPGFDDPIEAFGTLFYGGAANALRDLSPQQRAVMDPGLVQVAEQAAGLSLLDYTAAMNVRADLTERMGRFHARYDLLLSPALPIPAFKAGLEVPEGWYNERWPSWSPFTYPFNMTGQPAASVPCGFTRAGLPIGLQIVAARHRDALVLQAAHAYQQARPLTDRRPALLDA